MAFLNWKLMKKIAESDLKRSTFHVQTKLSNSFACLFKTEMAEQRDKKKRLIPIAKERVGQNQ